MVFEKKEHAQGLYLTKRKRGRKRRPLFLPGRKGEKRRPNPAGTRGERGNGPVCQKLAIKGGSRGGMVADKRGKYRPSRSEKKKKRTISLN